MSPVRILLSNIFSHFADAHLHAFPIVPCGNIFTDWRQTPAVIMLYLTWLQIRHPPSESRAALMCFPHGGECWCWPSSKAAGNLPLARRFHFASIIIETQYNNLLLQQTQTLHPFRLPLHLSVVSAREDRWCMWKILNTSQKAIFILHTTANPNERQQFRTCCLCSSKQIPWALLGCALYIHTRSQDADGGYRQEPLEQ